MTIILAALRSLGHRTSCVLSVKNRAILLSSETLSPIKRHLKINADGKKKKRFVPRHSWDGVPKDYQLIFESKVKDYVGGMKLTVTSVAVFALGLLAFDERTKTLTKKDLMVPGAAFGLLLTVLIVTNVAARRFFKRIYFNPVSERFIAVRRSFLGRNIRVNYSPEDIEVLRKPGEELDEGAVLKVKGRKISIGSDDFISSVYYNIHIGAGHYFDGRDMSQFPKF